MNRHRFVSVGIAAAIFVVLLLVVVQWAFHRASEDSFRIGVILPLTGRAAQFGQWAKEGISLGTNEVRSEGSQIGVIYEDSQNDPKTAVSAFNKLLNVDRVNAVIVLTSSDTLVLLPLATEKKVILFTGTILPGITEKSQYVFRNATNLRNEVDGMVNHMVTAENRPKVAVIYVNNDAGVWSQEYFTTQYRAIGGEVVGLEGYDPKAVDFRPQLIRLLSMSPEFLYLLSYGEFAQIMRQARELGFKGQFAGITTMEDAKAAEIAGPAAEGSVYTKAEFDPTQVSGDAVAFVKEYIKCYGRPPELYAATMRDAVHLLALAARNARPPHGDTLRDALLALPSFPGVSGETKFEANRDVKKAVIIKQIRDGKFTIYAADPL